VPHEYPGLVGTCSYLRHVTELINFAFRAERAVSPLDGSEFWVVLDSGLVAHQEASAFLRCLQGASRSPHTIRAYAGRTAMFLGWCSAQGVDWRRIELAELARFKHWVERSGRVRSGSTVNAILTAVCELLRFCARTGLIEAVVAERLCEPRWLRFTPPGFDAGESGQFRAVRARALKARAQASFPEALTRDQAGAVLACCRRPRERFLVILLHDTGVFSRGAYPDTLVVLLVSPGQRLINMVHLRHGCGGAT
jgi:integrase/recombinase XerD